MPRKKTRINEHTCFPTPSFICFSLKDLPYAYEFDEIDLFLLNFMMKFFFQSHLTNYEPLIFEHKVNLDSEHWNRDFLINA